ncbi:thiamine pyrophosphate-requiring protein [Psychromarinibacter sp. C21-152]|uniref:Thiamine pyrophosphate-requiring protein n=1 Tax=Psychromarinibacter sediminicola TaxID=3033385 RepID=A0AAE3NPQ3_9RHOB|nr:thiamine pyrophosphate-requiring protein [Psychromarinibacter sediminicola]MDF0599399.1 thiamine pyrophosphate-requiring protein [Psychromarinibacter sediminicola]
MAKDDGRNLSAGGAIFPRLKALGVDYVFANSGTDFPPIIEGLAEAAAKGEEMPQALVIPHEHAAMGMAHGYYLVTGKSQAVMLHTNVGLANGAIGAINAACEHVPMILMSGKTPVTEDTRFGARTVPIGWGQEMRDQAALVRESCKWENELSFPEQIAPLLDRAHAIANSTPKGPVYMSLPREVLCETVDAGAIGAPATMTPSVVGANPQAIATAAQWLAEAERPLIIAERGAGDADSFAAFGKWAEDWGIPVCSWWATHLAIPTDHPCHIGADPTPWLAEADVVVVLDCLAPWWPDKHPVNPEARVINMGPDPIFHRFPTRTFRSDLSIAGENADTIPALIAAMEGLDRDESAIAERRARVAMAAEETRKQIAEAAAECAKGITKAYVSLQLSVALEGRTSSVFSELGCMLGPLERRERNSWFQEPHSGGLGWSFPAALGAKLADRDRTCVATLGDGSYMFANPTACHQIAEALELGVVLIVLNNEEWGAVRNSVTGLYRDGYAAKANRMPLTALKPSPDFSKTAEASRAWAKRITDPADVLPAIREALDVADTGRTALLDIATLPG